MHGLYYDPKHGGCLRRIWRAGPDRYSVTKPNMRKSKCAFMFALFTFLRSKSFVSIFFLFSM